MELKAIKALTAAALLATATTATAGTAAFNLVSGPATPGVDVTLTIQENSNSGYDFVVSNNSLMGIVTGVYFGINWDSLLNDSIANSGDGVFDSTTTSPQSPEIDDWTGSSASHTVEQELRGIRHSRGRTENVWYDNIQDGIQEDGTHTFSYNALNDLVSLEDLEAMLGTEGFGVAIKVQGLTADEQQAGWGVAEEREEQLLVVSRLAVQDPGEEVEVSAAPSPTAAIAGLGVLGLAGLRRRRRNK